MFLYFLRRKAQDLYAEFLDETSDEQAAVRYLHSLIRSEVRVQSFACALIEGFLIAAKHDAAQLAQSSVLKAHAEHHQNEANPQDSRNYSEQVLHVARRPLGMVTFPPILEP